MKRALLAIISMLLVGALTMPAMAQQQPDQRQGDRNRGDSTGGGGGGGRRGGGPVDDGGRGPGMRGPGIEVAKYEALRSYIDTVERYSKLAQDPQAAGVAAVISAADLLRQRGHERAIEFFTKMLPEVKNPTIERAIRIQLADLYKMAGQGDKALDQYEALMKGVAPTQPAAAAAPTDATKSAPPQRP